MSLFGLIFVIRFVGFVVADFCRFSGDSSFGLFQDSAHTSKSENSTQKGQKSSSPCPQLTGQALFEVRSQRSFRSASPIGRSLMLANRRCMRPLAANSQFSFP